MAAPERPAAGYSPSQMQKEKPMQSESKALKHCIPWFMAATRATLGPVMVIGGRAGWSGLTLAALVVTALLSDIFDGVLARRWKCDTAAVRFFDSMADKVFYLGCGASLWMRHTHLMRSFAVPIGVVLGIEVLKLAFDFMKFGKPASYHSYLAKMWGLVLATTVVMSFATNVTLALRIAWWASLMLGLLACFEGLAISLLMPEWRHDLKTLWRALDVRRQILTNRNVGRTARLIGTVVATMLVLIATSAHASSIPSVTFIGGSTPGVTTGTARALDTGPDQIAFQWNGGSFAIPLYADSKFQLSREGSQSRGAADDRCRISAPAAPLTHRVDQLSRPFRPETGCDLRGAKAGEGHVAGRAARAYRRLLRPIPATVPYRRCSAKTADTQRRRAIRKNARVV